MQAHRVLTLLLTDLYLDAELRDRAAQAAAPELRALELMLARAGAREAVGWREFALREAGAAPLAAIPVAAFSRLATGDADPDGNWWVATAVELQAAHDHVQLAQVLSLRDAEWQLLAAGFNAAFGADACRLEAGQGAAAYLRFAQPLDATGTDPERIAGGDVHDALPSGPQGNALRRLMTEVQMWLHEHPLNLERAVRGEAPVTGLWFWGGGELPPRSRPAPMPALVASDAFLRGLWRWAGEEPAHTTPTFAGVLETLRSRSCIVALAMREQPGASWAERLVAVDRAWLGPALAALRSGAIGMLRLQASDALFTLSSLDLWRIWRRPRPWLEALA